MHAQACAVDRDCPSGSICIRGKGLCRPLSAFTVSALCSSDGDCRGNQFCDVAQFVPVGSSTGACRDRAPIGGACAFDNQCASGMCNSAFGSGSSPSVNIGRGGKPRLPTGMVASSAISRRFSRSSVPNILRNLCPYLQLYTGTAQPSNTCIGCSRTSDCAASAYCDSGKGTCAPKQAAGGACRLDEQCMSDVCDGSKCVECAEAADCAPGEVCLVSTQTCVKLNPAPKPGALKPPSTGRPVGLPDASSAQPHQGACPFSSSCQDGQYCDKRDGVCKDVKGSGEACAFASEYECRYGRRSFRMPGTICQVFI